LERLEVATFVRTTIDSTLRCVIDQLAEREGKKGDKKTIDYLLTTYGRDARLLTYRILDEMLIKEQR